MSKRRLAAMLKRVILALAALALPSRAHAQSTAWHPAPGHEEIPLWPGPVPDARAGVPAESAGPVVGHDVAGRPWIYVANVTRPTITVYSPDSNNSGAAVVVFPGGGYNVLAIDLEGTEACDWATSKGMTCILLKYRVPCAKTGRYLDCRTALEDAQRALGMVRHRAAEWHVDPHRIGVLGFSAGGHMVAAISNRWATRLYPRVDAADDESCRPDFAIALYPGHLAAESNHWAFNPDIHVTGRTPPTFIVQAEDDPVDPVENSIVYHAALRKAKVPVELHL
ncbi:MAG TPA: alpha/beta hydrolase, partial [Gemmatimonadaceae bacterium]